MHMQQHRIYLFCLLFLPFFFFFFFFSHFEGITSIFKSPFVVDVVEGHSLGPVFVLLSQLAVSC